MVAKSKPNEIVITREYDAPVAMVWDAWTDVQQVEQWWGPRGFTLTTHSKDLRPGGEWRYTMHGPDGTDWPNVTVYHEVEHQKKLVYDHGGNDSQPPMFRVTVLFSERDGKTLMEMTMAFPSAEGFQQGKKIIKEAGGNATWDRLAEHLAVREGGGPSFVINRSFEAPPSAVFDMWTNPERLVRWLPPAGFKMELLRANIREGGDAYFRMSNEEGVTLYGRFEYGRIDPPNLISYVQRFCDENENPGSHPGLPVWPETMITTVRLVAESPDSTRVTVTTKPSGEFTPEEASEFLDTRGAMTQGWTGSFDQMEERLLSEGVAAG